MLASLESFVSSVARTVFRCFSSFNRAMISSFGAVPSAKASMGGPSW